jgi:hypothetical protein
MESPDKVRMHIKLHDGATFVAHGSVGTTEMGVGFIYPTAL